MKILIEKGKEVLEYVESKIVVMERVEVGR